GHRGLAAAWLVFVHRLALGDPYFHARVTVLQPLLWRRAAEIGAGIDQSRLEAGEHLVDVEAPGRGVVAQGPYPVVLVLRARQRGIEVGERRQQRARAHEGVE